MGLRRLMCFSSAETPDHGRTEDGWMNQEMEQPGTSYGGSSSGAATPCSSACRKNGKGRDRESENRVLNCSKGGAQLLACFRAGAINLIVHPACELACQRHGASTVQPVNSLPRSTFLDGAEDHGSGDDPTSPVVTCIGQVRKEKSNKTPPRATTTAAEASQLRSLKSKAQNRVEESSTSASSSPRTSKWKQILGARGTVNPSQQHQQQQQQTHGEAPEASEFYIDLNRFGCVASSTTTQITPTFGNFHKKFGRPDALAQTLTTSDDDPARNGSHGIGASRDGAAALRAPGAAKEGVQLWKRRSGACRPMSLDLQRRVVQIK